MAQGNLVAAQLDGRVVEDAAAQPAAQAALRLPGLQLLEDDGIRVLLQHPVLVAVLAQPPFEQVSRVARVALVEVDGDQLEFYRRLPLQGAQAVQQGVRVLAPGHGHENAVPVGDQLEIVDRPADIREQALLEPSHLVALCGRVGHESLPPGDPSRPPGARAYSPHLGAFG
jgi:hypothetical protein